MTLILVSVTAVVLFYFGMRWFVETPPARILASLRMVLVVFLALVAIGLAVAGRWGLATTVAAVAYMILAAGGGVGQMRGGGGHPGRSTVRSAGLEMTLDHGSGEMDGVVLAGPMAGRALASLDDGELMDLREAFGADEESRLLLEAYLDRRMPGWRAHGDDDGGARQGGSANARAMSDEEAYQILGLQPGAGEAEIRAAHRRLMKRVHPDQGGSDFLAARINEAKDRLLQRHR